MSACGSRSASNQKGAFDIVVLVLAEVLDMDEGALSRTEEIVLESRESDGYARGGDGNRGYLE